MDAVSAERDILDLNEVAVAAREKFSDPEPHTFDHQGIRFIEMSSISSPVSIDNRAKVGIEITRTISGYRDMSFSAVFHAPYGFLKRLSGLNTTIKFGWNGAEPKVFHQVRKSNIGPESIPPCRSGFKDDDLFQIYQYLEILRDAGRFSMYEYRRYGQGQVSITLDAFNHCEIRIYIESVGSSVFYA